MVINLISDADQTDALLPVAADLVDRFGLPTVNHPRRIGMTTRDAVARLLEGIPNCRVPKALRLKAGADRSPDALRAMLPFSCPILARPVGTHGGDDFEKIEDHAPLAAFLSRHSDHDCYLTQYIDYRSEDGYFRKYRFIFVDGEILPYHLCIGSDWKLHHISTDMANQPWMQREEEAFLNEPDAVFAPAHYQALQTIRQRVGLEYCGIDCALDACGNLVVFEVNASMLVHARNEDFPYKAPAVSRIKHAFDEMLRQIREIRLDAYPVGSYFSSCTCSIAVSVLSLSRPVGFLGLRSAPSIAGKFAGGSLPAASVDRPDAVASASAASSGSSISRTPMRRLFFSIFGGGGGV